MAGPKALILTASIGEGHDLPARVLAEALAQRGAQPQVVDALTVMGPLAARLADGATQFDTRAGHVAFDVGYALISRIGLTRRLISAGLARAVSPGLLALIAAQRPAVVVSTYPGSTEALGRLRARGLLAVPVVSAITDLAALRFWASPGVDLHLTIHPESTAEVRAIAGPGARVEPVLGLTDPRFHDPPSVAVARAALGLLAQGSVVTVSGGGWGVGDLAGAVSEALAAGAGTVLVLAGRNEALRERLAASFAGRPEVRVLAFTDAMPDVLSASDVLVHATAGLTVLEAMRCGCAVVSYGWGRGHIRANNQAYVRHGLADVAHDRAQLRAALGRRLAQGRPDRWLPRLPEAADLVLELAQTPELG